MNIYTFANISVASLLAITNAAGYRPLDWSIYTDVSQLIYIRTNINGYFFDAVLREVHETGLRITEHPVQSGANIVDHSFIIPARLILEIGMSDVMASYVTGQFSSASTKSVSAYQTLLSLQASRKPLIVTTMLNSYKNMLIESMNAPRDSRSRYGLRVTVTLRQILTAKVTQTSTTDSSRSQATDTTNKGTVSSEQVTLNTSNYSSIAKILTGE